MNTIAMPNNTAAEPKPSLRQRLIDRLGRNFEADVADFQPGLLAIQESPPARLPRAMFYVVATLFVLLLAWAVFGKLDIVASAEGKLIPASYTKIVQPAESGVVREILVKDGDEVQAGQVLVRLDPTLAGADAQTVASELAFKRKTLRRIDAELAGQPIALAAGDDPGIFAQVQAQGLARRQAYLDSLAQETATKQQAEGQLSAAQETLSKLQQTLPTYRRQAEAHKKLVDEGFFSALAGADKEREFIEKSQELKAQQATVASLRSTISAQNQKVAALTSQYRSQLQTERTEVMAQLAKLGQDDKKQTFRQGLLELRAPQAGRVKDLATTTPGAVVQPGMVLLTLVPKGEELLVEVQVRNEDVGFVQPGQEVQVKLATYPFQKYGLLQGTVQTVAADSQTPQQQAQTATSMSAAANPLTYRALIKLQTQYLEQPASSSASGKPRRLPLEAGMAATAEIHQGKRSVLEYLLSPVQKVAHEAGRER